MVDLSGVFYFILSFAVLIYSIILHEIAHGYVAYRLGDMTAKLDGRLTLNPIPHIDPIGTLLLPIALKLLNSPVAFGWAKPVPVNYHNLRGGEWDYFWVSIAGIIVNICLALLGSLLYHLCALGIFPGRDIVIYLSSYMILYNILLALFNLIPIPPLDGSRLIRTVLPREYQGFLDQLEPYGFFILFAFLYLFQSRLASSVDLFYQLLLR
jgi:Zn-dependent protease